LEFQLILTARQQLRRVLALTLSFVAAACATARPINEAPPTAATSVSTPAGLPVHPVAAAKPPPGPVAPLVSRVTLVATGDIMAHGAVKEAAAAAGGFDALYAPVAGVIGPADLAFGNLETPVAPKSDHGSRSFVFNAPPAMLTALKKVGFDVVLFANNHVYDQDRNGFIESLGSLSDSGLKWLGAGKTRDEAQAPLRLEVNGMKIAWFGAAQFFNDPKNVDDPTQPAANLIDGPAMAAAIAKVRPEVDAVLVSVHWGVEYMEAPRQSEIDLAHQWFDAGADVIIGSHPHILQPLEIYRASDGRICMCLYSLGNFISNQSRQYVLHASADKVGDSRDGVIVKFALEKRSYGAAGTAINLADVSYVPLWTDNNYFRPRGAPVDIHPIVIDDELKRIDARLGEMEKANPALKGAGSTKPIDPRNRAYVELVQRKELLTFRRARIINRLGEDFSGDP
jgi:poly-gamma-glutamate synthesis protein (capsule biosynthesis protein)